MQFKALVQGQIKDKEGGTIYLDEGGAHVQASWKGMFNKMIEWAGNDFERQKTLGAALWRYAQVTNDWNSFWHDTKISVRPKNEVLEIGGILPFAPHKEWSDTILEPMRKITQVSTAFGQWFERMSMYGGAPTYGASYDVVGSAEQFKQRLWAMNTRILSPEFQEQFEAQAKDQGMIKKDKDAFMDAFVEEANIYPKYHIVWIGGIDRNPWGSSTSYGIQSALGAGYHYGSASMWDFRWYRPMMEKKDWIPMSIFTLPVKPAIPLGLLFYRAFRGAQMAGWGYPGRWEYTGSSMQPYSYVPSSK
ncbi:hypothetical protein HYT84_05010, partial [Candidatus Micrarchaeota archaeon]|nr:hypothetical protein [Candidatus Micrarchaeota archaeon]